MKEEERKLFVPPCLELWQFIAGNSLYSSSGAKGFNYLTPQSWDRENYRLMPPTFFETYHRNKI
jgi:hypothetical protein